VHRITSFTADLMLFVVLNNINKMVHPERYSRCLP